MKLIIWAKPGSALTFQLGEEKFPVWSENFMSTVGDMYNQGVTDIFFMGPHVFTEHLIEKIEQQYPNIKIHS